MFACFRSTEAPALRRRIMVPRSLGNRVLSELLISCRENRHPRYATGGRERGVMSGVDGISPFALDP